MSPKTNGQDTIYQMVTDRIMAELENGVVPWHRPWQTAGIPKNLVSKKEYRGINVFLLACTEFGSPYWLSFKQVKQLGGQVRKGSKSTVVVFWKWLEPKDKEKTIMNVRNTSHLLSPAYGKITGIRDQEDGYIRITIMIKICFSSRLVL